MRQSEFPIKNIPLKDPHLLWLVILKCTVEKCFIIYVKQAHEFCFVLERENKLTTKEFYFSKYSNFIQNYIKQQQTCLKWIDII